MLPAKAPKGRRIQILSAIVFFCSTASMLGSLILDSVPAYTLGLATFATMASAAAIYSTAAAPGRAYAHQEHKLFIAALGFSTLLLIEIGRLVLRS